MQHLLRDKLHENVELITRPKLYIIGSKTVTLTQAKKSFVEISLICPLRIKILPIFTFEAEPVFDDLAYSKKSTDLSIDGQNVSQLPTIDV